MQDNEFIDVQDLQKLLGISTSSVYRLIRSDGFKTVKIMGKVLIRKNDLDEYLLQHTRVGER